MTCHMQDTFQQTEMLQTLDQKVFTVTFENTIASPEIPAAGSISYKLATSLAQTSGVTQSASNVRSRWGAIGALIMPNVNP